MSRIARAQAYPARPIRIVVGFAPAGPADIVARLMGQWLSERLGQPFIIENRPGAASNIGTDAVVKAQPDGYTLLLTTSSNAINATLYDKLTFDFLRDITPVASISREPNVMVGEFIGSRKDGSRVHRLRQGQSRQDQHGVGRQRNLASCGRGDVQDDGWRQHGSCALSRRGPALTDLLGGQVQVMFAVMSSAIEYIRAGKLRPLAVTTATRSEALADIPTVDSFIPGYEASAYFGIGAPKNTPAEIVDRLNKEINAVLADSKTKARLAGLGSTVLPGSPADAGKLLTEETEKWAKVVKFSGAKPE